MPGYKACRSLILNFFIPLIICLLCFTFAKGQEFFNVKTNQFLGNTRSYGALFGKNSNLIITASSDQASGKNTGGMLFLLNGNNIQESFILLDVNGKELFIKNICQLADKSLVIFYSTDEEPFPTVIIDGRLYCARFNEEFEMVWNYQIDTGGNSVLGKHLQCQASDSGVVIFSFFGSDAYYIGGIREDGQLIWNMKLGEFISGSSSTIIFNQDVRGDQVLFNYFQTSLNQSIILKIDAFTGTILSNIVVPDYMLSCISFTDRGWVVAGTMETSFFVCSFDENDNLLVSKQFFSSQIRGRLQISPVENRAELVITASNLISVGIIRLSYGLELIESSILRDISFSNFLIHNSLGFPTLTLISNKEDYLESDFFYTVLPLELKNRSCSGGELCFDVSDITIRTSQQMVVSSNFALLTTTVKPFWREISSESSSFCSNNKATIGTSASFLVNDTLCTMQAVQISDLANGGAREVLWEFPGANVISSTNLNPAEIFYPSPGDFIIRQIVTGNCTLDTFERTVHVLLQPALNLPNDTILCNDSLITIEPIYDVKFSGRWLDIDHPPLRIISNSGIYYFEVANQELCIQLDSISVTFINSDIQILGLSQSCEGPFDLSLSIDLPPNFKNYIWSLEPSIEPTIELPDRLFFDSLPNGRYIFSYSIVNGDCPYTEMKEVIILEKPIIEPIDNLRIKNGGVLVSPVVRGDYTDIIWSDGFTGLTRFILEPGPYQLKATNLVCEDATAFLVLPAYAFFAPNAFRPAGESNPTFKIYTNGEITIESIEIYDRWGSLLAICDNDAGWDGKSRGLRMPPGVFIFKAVGQTEEGEKVLISGEVTLFE